jgi:hypothetical protein
LLDILNSYILDLDYFIQNNYRKILSNKHYGKCAICFLEQTKFEIDHIIPLGAGGKNEIENLQPVCVECHDEKTREENELGIYFVNNQSSSCFNKVVIDNVFNSIFCCFFLNILL